MNGNPPDRFTVTPEPATVGQPATVCYRNPDRPNEHVDVLLFNGVEPGQTGHEGDGYSVYTDQDGLGCFFVYELPEWLSHVLRADDSRDHPVPTE